MPTPQKIAPPQLPVAPLEYDRVYIEQLLNSLRIYFNQLSSVSALSAAALNIDIRTLPTQLALATLRSGDVYRDTTADNTLKIKP
jgi:hypothetical protein